MSKYVYEQFVTPDQREKMTNDASGVRKTYFAAGKLDPLTPEKRLNTLYSAIRDVEGDETHPIVKALKNYMLSNGSTQEQIDDILKQGTAAYEASKEQPKAKVEKGISVPLDRAEPFSPLGVPTKVNSSELQAPVVSKPQPGEKGFTYQRVELFHQFEGNLLTTYIKANPSGYARDLLSEKTRDEQANILYSAQRGGDSNVINALEKHLINEKVFSPEQIESIKRAANQAELTISREQNEITAAVERGVSPIIKNNEGRNPAELPLVPFNVDNPEKSLVLASKLEKGNKLTFDEVLSKTGVVLSSSDQVLITEAFHKVGIMDIASKRNELLSGQIALTVATVVKNNPKLQPFVTEICDAFVDKATQDATRTALNGKFDPLKLQYQQQKKTEIEEELPSPDTRPRSNALTGRNDARAPKVEEIEAQDSIISVSTTEKGPSKVKVLSSSEVDPITEAIRKEILAEQQKLIKVQIALSNPSVNAMDSQRFREYLTSDPGKEEAAKVFAKPEIQTALNKIEVEGYKKVHAEFSDSFKNVNWTPDQVVAAGQPKTKTSEITNEDGLVVAKIKETTHDIAPLAVTLDNGDKVNVKSYRTIDFPKELEAGKGPLHLSMAVKDQNGRNISEKEAVYFTAHYDEQGKLTEISSPIPVKFMGNDDKAVGYIERNGKVYTLPVTQGKYKEMMKEVAKNQGMAVDLSQEVAQEAQDLALTKEKSRTPVLERDEEAVQPQKKTGRSEDSIALPETDAIPLQMVSVQGTAQDKTTAIDNMLRGVSPDRIVATLKDQVAKGGSEAVGLIVEATKEGRTGDHPGVHTLTAAQFKEVYETGMNAAKVISDKRAPEKQTKHAEDSMRNIHSACNKLTKPAAVDPADHMRAKRLHDRNFELKNLQRGR
ncbi:Sca4 family protein [Candidatus Megaera polyxenophila]|uniref:Sca4 family protein n=1 Tax=Candidatus Megaera polyxenophila TaxID=988779 RepID=UPI00249F3772|nr:Sca4 family protein [Candidatus Megaera polyxenophila]